MVNKLGKDVPQLKSSNTALKIQANDLQGLFDVHSKPPKQHLWGSSSARHGSEFIQGSCVFVQCGSSAEIHKLC
jgi:hypothetical protein